MTEQVELTPSEIRVYEFLDELRESGVTNMFGAGSYIEAEFGVDKKDAQEYLVSWMRGFGK